MANLQLVDATGPIDAILFREDGEMFFGNIPPCNFYSNDISMQMIGKRMAKLIEPSVWISCCLKSYEIKDVRKYRIFDTSLDLQKFT